MVANALESVESDWQISLTAEAYERTASGEYDAYLYADEVSDEIFHTVFVKSGEPINAELLTEVDATADRLGIAQYYRCGRVDQPTAKAISKVLFAGIR